MQDNLPHLAGRHEMELGEKMLPETLKSCFWDCDFASLDPLVHRRFIAERILVYGDSPAVRWLLATVPADVLKEIVSSARNLDPKTRNYWRMWLDSRTDH